MPNMTTYCHSEADTGRNRTEVSSVTRIASSPIAVTTQPIHFLSKKNSRPMGNEASGWDSFAMSLT